MSRQFPIQTDNMENNSIEKFFLRSSSGIGLYTVQAFQSFSKWKCFKWTKQEINK